MKHATLAAFALLMTALSALPVHAAPLRAPQVPVAGNSLQNYFNGVGESINVGADQLDIQRWRTTLSGNSAMTLMIELAAGSGSNAIGIYNAAGGVASAQYELFPASAPAGWFAVASFRSATSTLIVNLFNEAGALQGTDTHGGVATNDFGYYILNPDGIGYTQDARQPGTNEARALVFAGTGDNAGCWWLCFEDKSSDGLDEADDFDDAVVFLESINPTPVSRSTWGSVKSRFR